MRYVDRRLAEIRAEQALLEEQRQQAAAAAQEAALAAAREAVKSLKHKRIGRPMTVEERRAYFREYQRKARREGRGRERMMRENLLRNHGFSLEEYEELFQRQRGACAICGGALVRAYDPSSEPGGSPGPRAGGCHVDHDHACCPGSHSCGLCIRGLLCGKCNTGLACFRDDPEVLRSAARYLESRRSSRT